jgi:hypothetical protein
MRILYLFSMLLLAEGALLHKEPHLPKECGQRKLEDTAGDALSADCSSSVAPRSVDSTVLGTTDKWCWPECQRKFVGQPAQLEDKAIAGNALPAASSSPVVPRSIKSTVLEIINKFKSGQRKSVGQPPQLGDEAAWKSGQRKFVGQPAKPEDEASAGSTLSAA